MDVVNYRGFELHATPYRLAKTGHWRINIQIVRHTSDQVKSREFGASNSYPTREEAVAHCFQFGRQIIDGQAPDCSVSDL